MLPDAKAEKSTLHTVQPAMDIVREMTGRLDPKTRDLAIGQAAFLLNQMTILLADQPPLDELAVPLKLEGRTMYRTYFTDRLAKEAHLRRSVAARVVSRAVLDIAHGIYNFNSHKGIESDPHALADELRLRLDRNKADWIQAGNPQLN